MVRSTSSSTPPTTCFTVPSSPHRTPAASRISLTRKAVVVLPLVPVTPTTFSSPVGSPQNRAARGAIAARASPTTTSATPSPSARSTTNPTAPASTAAAANRCPSTFSPGTQKNNAPGSTLRLS